MSTAIHNDLCNQPQQLSWAVA